MGEGDEPQDLEERTYEFARDVWELVKRLPRTEANLEDIPQLVRASGSAGANYIEANDALGKKDFLMRMRISRKESKESRLFLRLVDCGEDAAIDRERHRLADEAKELKLIFSSIIKKSGG
ncbi:MAG: four helix bundle protein [Verrucomicrobiota bacterium]